MSILQTIIGTSDTIGWRIAAAVAVFGGFFVLRMIFKAMKAWVVIILFGILAFFLLGIIFINIFNEAPDSLESTSQGIESRTSTITSKFWDLVAPLFKTN